MISVHLWFLHFQGNPCETYKRHSIVWRAWKWCTFGLHSHQISTQLNTYERFWTSACCCCVVHTENEGVPFRRMLSIALAEFIEVVHRSFSGRHFVCLSKFITCLYFTRRKKKVILVVVVSESTDHWRQDYWWYIPLEAGFSEVLVSYIIGNAPWSLNSTLEKRNFSNPEITIQHDYHVHQQWIEAEHATVYQPLSSVSVS